MHFTTAIQMFEFQELWHHSVTCISNTQNLSKRMASLNLQSAAKCFRTATYWLTVTPASLARLSNSYLVTKADFWGFNCFWRCSTIVSWENLLLTMSWPSSLSPIGTFQWEDQLTGRFSSVSSRSLHWPRRRILAVLRTLRSQLPLWTSERSWFYEPNLVPHQTRLASWNVVWVLFRNVLTFSQ